MNDIALFECSRIDHLQTFDPYRENIFGKLFRARWWLWDASLEWSYVLGMGVLSFEVMNTALFVSQDFPDRKATRKAPIKNLYQCVVPTGFPSLTNDQCERVFQTLDNVVTGREKLQGSNYAHAYIGPRAVTPCIDNRGDIFETCHCCGEHKYVMALPVVTLRVESACGNCGAVWGYSHQMLTMANRGEEASVDLLRHEIRPGVIPCPMH